MKFLLSESYGNTLTQVFTTAMKRGILPTWMGSAELDELELAIKERAVFSARTTNAVYLEALHEKIGRLLANGYDGDQAKLRLELKQLLAELAYNPETGFPGDAALGIPAARAGSLQDISSDKRINLILDTQLELMAGKGQEQRGLSKEALDLFPAWELVRIKEARVPRDWFTRFKQAGGRVLEDADGRKRLVAHKLDEVWSVLGDRSLFKDALDVSHPPFAFGSGMAWQAIEQAEWDSLAGTKNKEPSTQNLPANVIQFPSAQVSTDGLSAETLKRLKATMQNAEAKVGKLTLKSIIGTAPPPPSSSRLNALCNELLSVAMVAEINGRIRLSKQGRETGEKGRGKLGQVRAVKAPGKKCGSGWIADWMECGQRASVVGKDGDATSLGLPSLRTVGKSLSAKRPELHEAKRELASKPSIKSPTGNRVGFGKIAMDHARLKEVKGEKDRVRWINHAKATIANPLEVWREGMRHRYIAVFDTSHGKKSFIVVTARTGENDDQVISFHPGKSWNTLAVDRQGTLLFKGYDDKV